ncbi:MAG: nitrilase family protein [Paludibacter sp.]|nr:nitrilase family protein [Paludibacter sp.]
MKISLVQSNLHWADKQRNFSDFETRLAALKDSTNLAILPEMFSTGCCYKRTDLAENNEGETIFLLKKWAKNFNFAIAGSFFAQENDKKSYNRAFLVMPDGKISFADKRHTFSLAGESTYITKGNKKLIVNYLGVNICIMVCYDIRFPVWVRNVENQYDLLVFVANFPDSRIAAWDALLPARAIENQTFVCGVNCVGTDGEGIFYSGHSALFDYAGKIITRCPDNTEKTLTAEINLLGLQKFRTKFPFYKDADKFIIH